jgi:hypothetical protein
MSKTNDSDEPRSPNDGRRRQQLIDQCLATLGNSWASTWFEEMSQTRRGIEGGWPGRLGEARTLVLRELPKQLAAQGLAPPSASELASAPTTVNDHARTAWLQASKAQRLAARGVRAQGDD